MSSTQIDHGALCVSIHDVAPATWADCARLLQAIREVADIPLTLLVVPQFHGNTDEPATYLRSLEQLLAQGHELALHGYTHFDSAPPDPSLRSRFLRTVYTQQEGEFAALDSAQAHCLIELGLEWFARHGWPVAGFIPPAWLLSDAAWQALVQFPFEYTTTMPALHLLPERVSLRSPSLVYTARNAPGRALSPRWADLLALRLQGNPLARLSLHPRDARYPALVQHAQKTIRHLLESRTAMTKAAFAQRWRAQCALSPAAQDAA